ncbi:HDOD domain-containing protein [Oryzomonas sagensis]|uniref:HDOD domain-containing protein n=1 Tax=Oryzomonas sagensis TaxID=2603857 RepID=A0ABQ6TUA3_9BACT|nr:HDOD domain-containing protein [Oryzomonas sagensis]KAB0672384.1 HDOD domain-containing protein [Oryzomonas sagensis]
MSFAERAPITLERLVEQTRTIYSLPYFYERFNEAINHPRSSIADIAKIIIEDQGLTARILKLANSPLFGYYSRVDSITKAVTIIGTQQLRDLAFAASAMGVFKGIPDDLMNMALFWRHSIACGIIARNLATCLRESNVERFFVAGILHDVGQLILCAAIPETAGEVLALSRSRQEHYHHTERDQLGFDHADLGGALLQAWKLPANIFEPVACHHAPRSAAQFPLESAIVHLAEIVCQAFEFGASGEWCVSPLDPAAWDRLGMPVNILATILKQSEPQIEETFDILMEGQ